MELDQWSQMAIDMLVQVPISICYKDQKRRFVAVSLHKAKKWGVDYREMLGKRDEDFMDPNEAKISAEDDARVIETGIPIIEKLEPITRPTGMTWVSVTETPWRDDNDIIQGLIVVDVDVTELQLTLMELKKVKEELERALGEEKEQFETILDLIAVMNHRLKSPLNGLACALKLISRGYYGKIDESVKRTVNELLTRTERVIRTIDRHISQSSILTKLEKVVPPRKEMDMSEDIFDPVLAEFEPIFRENNIHIDNKLGGIPAGEIKVAADDRLPLVVEELLSNAIKYGGPETEIAIGVEDWGDFHRFSVWNSGKSIPAGQEDKIFEKFERGDASQSNIRGTGLGLYECRIVIESLKGRIWCENDRGHPKFSFTLLKWKE